MKHQGPLLGYNNNVNYKGGVYHVQTEDSGTRRPRVITHLFADGGRVVSSAKTSYEDLLEAPDLSDQVRAIMKRQHKAMVVALADGEFDALIGHEQAAAPHAAKSNAAEQLATPEQLVAPEQLAASAKTAGPISTEVASETAQTSRPFGARYNSGRRLDEIVAARLLLLDL